MTQNGFVLRECKGIRYGVCEAFERIPDLRHGFSTRLGGPGEGEFNLNYASWDSVERVDRNRSRFLSALELEGSKLATLHQVHSNRVLIIEDSFAKENQSDGDALATRSEGVALGIKTADCVPILIADPRTHSIAAVHSGWRGTLSGVLPQTLLAMRRVFGSSPADLLVAIGPAIRACCFEVGSDVAGLFQRAYPDSALAEPIENRPGKYLLDLYGALRIQLEEAGVQPENRFDLGECTACNTETYFSYRKEGAGSGRMMAVIGLKS